jgi:hypothetical protein
LQQIFVHHCPHFSCSSHGNPWSSTAYKSYPTKTMTSTCNCSVKTFSRNCSWCLICNHVLTTNRQKVTTAVNFLSGCTVCIFSLTPS